LFTQNKIIYAIRLL